MLGCQDAHSPFLSCPCSCGHCRNQEPCSPTEGACLACDPGWNGTHCSQPCPLGLYGDNCTQPCPRHCLQGEACQPQTGRCQNCEAGFMGARWGLSLGPLSGCQKQGGKEARAALQSCGRDVASGESAPAPERDPSSLCFCLSSPPWLCCRCEAPCPPGFFGEGCRSSCPNCFHGSCDPASGTCLCQPGYWGTR